MRPAEGPETPVHGQRERLWLTEPRRATCLAEVQEVRDDRFLVDRALFAPRSRACRHPQRHDAGTLWWDGEKRRLGAVVEEDGRVWYTLRGTVPDVGATLQCQLDQEVRAEASRAHTAMHLWLSEFPENIPLVADPEVKGGGHFRLTYAWPPAREALAETVRKIQQAIDADLPVERDFAPRASVARFVTPQTFDPPDPVPGPEVLPLVRIGKQTLPCDGTHVERTGKVGSFHVAHAAAGKDGFVVNGRVS